jgi:hypothetical protein
MGARLNQAVRNYLTLGNYELHHDLAYSLTYSRLPPELLPKIWDDLVDAEVKLWRGGMRKLLHIEDKLVNARVRRFSGRQWNDYCWGPLSLVRQAERPGAFGTDWIVEYVIPQLELMFAWNDSSEIVRYEEGIVFDKVSWHEHGMEGEVDFRALD